MVVNNIIYALFCPISKVPVYIGLSKNGISRPWEHIVEKSHSTEVNLWVKYLNENLNERPTIVVLDYSDSEDLLKDKEKFWIQKYISEGYTLLNMTHVKSGYFIYTNRYNEEDPLKFVRMYIKEKRKFHKLTQEELSKKAGVGIRFLREVEQAVKIKLRKIFSRCDYK